MAEPAAADGGPKISKRAAEKAEKKAAAKAKKEQSKTVKPPDNSNASNIIVPIKGTEISSNPLSSLETERTAFSQGWLKATYEEICRLHPENKETCTRFPPEPNGFLHIGHAKAIFVNFGFASYHNNGPCYLRFDDTNPQKEEAQYFESIENDVRWLGFEPREITHSSDRFEDLYDLAEKLILKDGAYVCFCSREEINHQKGGEGKTERYYCPHRSRPVADSMEDFRGMRDGRFKAKEAVLRFKHPEYLTNGNTYLWDLAAYRIVDQPHHRTKDTWRIYPTYDFAHCLCDSLEHITHSLCTVEFFQARTLYNWLVNELKEYLPTIPEQREYGRLNVTGTLLSKRKILELVSRGIVRGYNDPRLYTLAALRRRGIPPGAVRAFVAELGVSDAFSTIQTARLESTVRKYLDPSVPRVMLVLDPIPVILTNLPDGYAEEIEAPLFPKDPHSAMRKIPFTNTIYIDRSDFRSEDSKEFFRLAPGKVVGLQYVPFPIRATDFKTNEKGLVVEISATYEKPEEGAKTNKPKAWLQWVALSSEHKSPVKAEVRIFNPLFKSEKPEEVEGGFLNDLSENSEEIFHDAVIETGIWEVKRSGPYPKDHVRNAHPGPWDTRFQGIRVAYFTEDTDSTDDHLVLNKIVSLKEDNLKNS